MKDFQNFAPHYCILVFGAEQVYLKLQVINLKNKEVTVNPKSQTLETPNPRKKSCQFERKIWLAHIHAYLREGCLGVCLVHVLDES